MTARMRSVIVTASRHQTRLVTIRPIVFSYVCTRQVMNLLSVIQ